MRLADFIDANIHMILIEWDSFAATMLPAAELMDAAAIRNHSEQMLHAIAKDLRVAQTYQEQADKSKGLAPVRAGDTETAAQTHALQRAKAGFSIRQLVAEYRALRASVLRLWTDAGPYGRMAMEDTERFNEAVDQAIAESVDFYSKEVERWRALLLGMLGHDLRGPLNAILVTSKLISTMSAGRSVSQHVDTLMRSGERMNELLDDLLDYNRTSLDIGIRVTPKQIDLTQVCREEIELLNAALPSSTIEFWTDGIVHGQWDASRIKQAINNLVVNAAKYGNQSGIIRVKLRGDDTHAYLSIENTGPCIPKELLRTLFEPLRRHGLANGQNERVSLGLGLFIVHQVVLAHGGNITAESSDGETCFSITLPKGAKQTEQA